MMTLPQKASFGTNMCSFGTSLTLPSVTICFSFFRAFGSFIYALCIRGVEVVSIQQISPRSLQPKSYFLKWESERTNFKKKIEKEQTSIARALVRNMILSFLPYQPHDVYFAFI